MRDAGRHVRVMSVVPNSLRHVHLRRCEPQTGGNCGRGDVPDSEREMNQHKIRLRLDSSAFNVVLATKIPHCPLQIRERFLDLLDRPSEIAFIECDIGSADAGDMIIRLQPSERLVMLVAAARTSNVDRGIVEKTGHR